MSTDIANATDLRGRSDEELTVFLREKADELFKLRFQHFTGQLENVAKMKHVRREIARANTIVSEKNRSSQS